MCNCEQCPQLKFMPTKLKFIPAPEVLRVQMEEAVPLRGALKSMPCKWNFPKRLWLKKWGGQHVAHRSWPSALSQLYSQFNFTILVSSPMASFSHHRYFKNRVSNLRNPFVWAMPTVVTYLYNPVPATLQLSSYPDFLLESGAWKAATMPVTRLWLSDKHSNLLQEKNISSLYLTIEIVIGKTQECKRLQVKNKQKNQSCLLLSLPFLSNCPVRRMLWSSLSSVLIGLSCDPLRGPGSTLHLPITLTCSLGSIRADLCNIPWSDLVMTFSIISFRGTSFLQSKAVLP